MVSVIDYSESEHPLIKPLLSYSDEQLINLFYAHKEQGKYFVAIYCRYCGLVFMVTSQQQQVPTVNDYLLAAIWHHIFIQMSQKREIENLPHWLTTTTKACLNQIVVPAEVSNNELKISVPLWCYIQISLEKISPLNRLILVLTDKFNWSLTRITAYLQTEGEMFSLEALKTQLEQAYLELEQVLPEDINIIYLQSEETQN